MSTEPRAWAPLWLELSGLPELLSQKIKGGAGWSLLKKIIELDCERNAQPGTVEVSLNDLYARTGISPVAARKAVTALRKLQLLACFLPDNEEEPALFRLVLPLQTPLAFAEVSEKYPQMFAGVTSPARYTNVSSNTEDTETPANRDLQETVDLYFDAVGFKMNAFILDELRILVDLFPMDEIRRTFRRARQNEIRSLRWVMQELARRGKSSGSDTAPAEKKNNE